MKKYKREIESIIKCQIEENEKIKHTFSFLDDTDALNFLARLMDLGLKPFLEPRFEAISSCRPEMFLQYSVGVKYEHLVPKSPYDKRHKAGEKQPETQELE